MEQNVIVLDLETKKTFQDVGGKENMGELGVSVVGVYNYATKEYKAYWEADFPKLFSLLSEKPLVVGFNHKHFDMPVLQPYFKNLDLKTLPMVDILEEMVKILKHRVSLDSVAEATLGKKKSGHGLDAIRYWNLKQLDKLEQYCLDDVKITKEVYEYGLKNGEIYFMDKYGSGKLKAEAAWKPKPVEDSTRQISLF